MKKQGKNHGFSKTRLYVIWCGIKARCNNSKEPIFKYYGGRGIKIFPEWESNFLNFKKWAENTNYNDSLTIERVDVNGNYEPDNCRWITKQEQQQNKRNTLYITYNNQTKRLKEWAYLYKMNYQTVYRRMYSGWSFEKALFTPIDESRKNNIYKMKGDINE